MSFFKRLRKINFQEKKLVICELGTIISKKGVKLHNTGDRLHDFGVETTCRPMKDYRILIMISENSFYEPQKIKKSHIYHRFKAFHEIGDIVVARCSNIPIQYCTNIKLTEKENKTKRISLERIEELENQLNCK